MRAATFLSVIETLTLVLGMVNLFMQRRDRRTDLDLSNEATKRAVRDFYTWARTWARLAEELRHSVIQWRGMGCPEDNDFGITSGAHQKKLYIANRRSRESQALGDLLHIYAPELLGDLERLAERATTNLEDMVPQLLAKKQEGEAALDDYVLAFEQRTDEVVAAVEALRRFTENNVPLTG